jgi:release factor glutamine methyltransferase
LAETIGQSRSYLYTWPDRALTSAQLNRFEKLLSRRYQGEPIAYITGHREFWSLDFAVSPAVLIPRPETERLVEIALQHLPEDQPATVADLGTGSGALALALAHERPRCQIVATDSSADALAIAEHNRQILKLSNVQLLPGCWFEPLTGRRFNVIVSNPPYVAEGDPHLLQGDLCFEPAQALIAGPDGLKAIRDIINAAPEHLKEGGWLMLEHGYNQGGAVMELLTQRGFKQVYCYQDYGERERATIGQLAGG